MGLKIFRSCLKLDVLYLLREVRRPWPIVRCEESPYDLINVLGPFLSFCCHKIFIKLNLPILLALVGQREKSQKCFDLSAFN